MSPVTSPALARIADEAWAIRLREPFFRLRLGLPIEHLPTGSLEEAERDAGAYRDIAAALAAIDLGALDRRDRVTHAFLSHIAAEGLDAPDYWREGFPVTPYAAFGFVYNLQQVFAGHVFAGSADGERYLSLMADYAAFVRTTRGRLEQQAARGWRIPAPALAGVRTTLARLQAYAPMALVPSHDRLAALGASAGALLSSISAMYASEIEPELAALVASVGPEYERAAPQGVGIGQYPGGEAAYRRAIRGHLTLAVEPQQLRDQGYDEVARITDEMAALRGRMGWAASEADFHEELRARPAPTPPRPRMSRRPIAGTSNGWPASSRSISTRSPRRPTTWRAWRPRWKPG